MQYTYKTKGVCSQMISFELEDNKISNVQFFGGCNGNLKGIGALVEGMDIDDVIARVEGIKCGMKSILEICPPLPVFRRDSAGVSGRLPPEHCGVPCTAPPLPVVLPAVGSSVGAQRPPLCRKSSGYAQGSGRKPGPYAERGGCLAVAGRSIGK